VQREQRFVEVIGGRWTLAVLAELVDGDCRYQYLHDALEGISYKVLTDTLRRAERDGLIGRHLDSERVETATLYNLTDLGRSLNEPLEALAQWVQANVGVRLLTEHRACVMSWAAQAGAELRPDAFVFSPFLEAATPFRPDNVTSFFMRVRDSVGAPTVRLHDLRHFTATQLIGAGVDVRTVAGRLGQSDPSLTLRVYSHLIEERDRTAAAIMGRVLSGTPDTLEMPPPIEAQSRRFRPTCRATFESPI
jgi:DNA-binding HxlR family transcriptional regulator